MGKTCERCDDAPVNKHGHLCADCFAEEIDYDEHDNDCANCGGEGFTYGCDWGWQCDTWDGDSCLCTQRCEWCNPVKRTPEQEAEYQALRKIMADALAPTQGERHDGEM